VLNLALEYGPVTVVTNAETGWVQLSAHKFIPLVVPILSKLTIISARSTYEPMFPGSPLKWKYYCQTNSTRTALLCVRSGRSVHIRPVLTRLCVCVCICCVVLVCVGFQERITALAPLNSKREKNILSFGDSHVEREAVRACTRGMPNTRTKSVKFAERPSMEQLRRQIELVTNCLQYIYSHEGDLDLQLTVTVNNAPTTPGAAAPAATKASDGTESKAMYGNALAANNNPLTTSEEKPMA